MTGMGPAHHALKYHRMPRQVDLIWPRVLKPIIYHCIIILGPPHPVKIKSSNDNHLGGGPVVRAWD